MEDGVEIQVEDARELLAQLRTLADDKCYTVLLIPGAFSHPTMEVKKMAQKELAATNRVGTAILIKNLAHQLLAQFFIQLSRPSTPIKPFKDKDEAVVWLRECLVSQGDGPVDPVT